MFSELTPRVLVGGFVSQHVSADFLERSGVTHIVNASDRALPPIVAKQFWTLELLGTNLDGEHDKKYWPKLFSFTSVALKKRINKLYFHVNPEIPSRPTSPVAVYAGLRAMGYSALESRRRLGAVHPIINWHDAGMRCVDHEFADWCRHHNVKPIRAAHQQPEKPMVVDEVDLAELLDGALGWTQ